MQTLISSQDASASLPIWLVGESSLGQLLQTLPSAQAAWVRSSGYGAERHKLLLLPGSDGQLGGALWGLGGTRDLNELSLWDAASLPDRLPAGTYRIATELPPAVATQLALGWVLGSYRFGHFRGNAPKPAVVNALVAPGGADVDYAHAAAQAMALARDLINTPANALGPAELAAAARSLVERFGGDIVVHSGDGLSREYPLIAAVGAGSSREPYLVDCRWRRPGAARVTLVGKGVCFDSGGLDLKPPSSMLLMKKDMGGAACVLGLAQLLLQLRAPIDLRVLIPAVENSVSGNAYRPGDVWKSRKGLTVEINNTDAEGRLVLADALTDADAEKPDLLIDMATLTGAARTALGPDIPAVFGTDDPLAQELCRLGRLHNDPLWQLPLWQAYDDELSSRVADLSNVSSSSFAGAIFGALFLKRFVTMTPRWLHLDLYAWNPKERGGRPMGGEAQCVRAVYQLIRQLYG
ncbi:MAG TPA: leucyl aminopeptidase family protein [Steroidobacteraceae bacterium]|jgi:leucyl aminopeptidase|nr:leucyl aminopeptidase family protein [Steroidobacteraceae bacterium]